MTPATSWSEQAASGAADWQEGLPGPGTPSDDYFIDFLMEGTAFYDPSATWAKASQAATAMTEMSQTATVFTEREAP